MLSHFRKISDSCEIEILVQTITTGRVIIIVWGRYLVLDQIYSPLTMSQGMWTLDVNIGVWGESLFIVKSWADDHG